jgi:hypothetical protein
LARLVTSISLADATQELAKRTARRTNTVGRIRPRIVKFIVGREHFDFIPFGSDTPKLASALMRVKMGNGESIYTQKTQCFGADVSLGVCCQV